MATAGNNPLYGRFDEMLDNVFHPGSDVRRG